MSTQPPYRRIVADLRNRIASGELAPGDRVPSTRAIMRDWGVAMATASKALAELRQQGWVHAVPGSGTVVAARSGRSRGESGPAAEPAAGSALSRQRMVRTAILLADAEGRGAVSMRRLAAELGVGPMSLYRHIPDKEELFRLMADTAFGAEALPDPGPDGWRAKLELLSWVQWRAYRRHPWLAPTLLNSLVRPQVVRSGLRHVDWGLRALAGTRLAERAKLLTVMSLHGYIGGIAISDALEVEYEQDTGVSGQQRQDAHRGTLIELLGSGQLPAFTRTLETMDSPTELDEVFAFGLRHQLDGIAAMLGER